MDYKEKVIAILNSKELSKEQKEKLEYIFPELKESEDDNIKSCIGMILTDAPENRFNDFNTSLKECLAWLEKQGNKDMGISDTTKQTLKDNLDNALKKETSESWNKFLEKQGKYKSADKFEPKFKVGDAISKKHNSDINDFGSFTITDITGGKYWYNDRIICDITEQDEWELYEPVRRNPAWSEEDEDMIQALNTCIDTTIRGGMHYISFGSKSILIGKVKTWLKSLSPRSQWKPSDEQMDALETAVSTLQSTALESLYNKLKKL